MQKFPDYVISYDYGFIKENFEKALHTPVHESNFPSIVFYSINHSFDDVTQGIGFLQALGFTLPTSSNGYFQITF